MSIPRRPIRPLTLATGLLAASLAGFLLAATVQPAPAYGQERPRDAGPERVADPAESNPSSGLRLDPFVRLHGLASSARSVPFWLQSRHHGRWGRAGNQVGGAAGIALADTAGSVAYTGRLEVLGRAGSQASTGYVHELYGAAEWGIFRFTAGRIAHTTGLVDTSLTAGSMTWSPNAAPVPRVAVSWPRFVRVPGTEGFARVKGYLAHGWMGASRYVRDPFLHEKQFYLRLLPNASPVHVHAGIVHNAIWGGTHPVDGELADDFTHFLETFLGYRPDRGDTAEDLGNTVAMYDFGIDYAFGPVRGLLYREFYIEDKPALWFRSPWDGLWGLSLHLGDETLPVHGLLWEHVYTIRQGSRYEQGEDPGADNYYNHSVYLSGWTYEGRSIGHPLLFSGESVVGVANNRLVAHHVGIEGSLGPYLDYRAFATYSRNYGASRVLERTPDGALRSRNGEHGRHDQWSFLLALTGAVPDRPLEGRLELAWDRGSVRPDAVGVLAGLTYRIGS